MKYNFRKGITMWGPFAFNRVRLAAIAMLVAGAGTWARAEDTPLSPGQPPQPAAASQPLIYPLAILPFTERGKEVADQGGKCTDMLFASLAANPDVYLVEREDLKKLLEEMELSAAGLTDSKNSTQIGQLTGAKILVAGSIFQAGNNIYVVAKLIGTETSRVVGASAKGKISDDLDSIVGVLAKEVVSELKKQGGLLIPPPLALEDRIAVLEKALGKGTPRGKIYIDVAERHVGQAVSDPAVETELARICDQLGFTVIDRKQGLKADADILLVGEGFSQFATRHGNFTSVKARVELKAVDPKTGRVLATDRQTAVTADLAELIASKAALEDATGRLASRLLPAMMMPKTSPDPKAK
jgi:curli biogenesis system outer membrane secretion channel CsgG